MTKRQLQVAKLVHEELAQIFTKNGWTIMNGGMVSIAEVQMTEDLLEAKVYFSFLNVNDEEATMEFIASKEKEIRGALGNALRHHLRRIPELLFYRDTVLDRVFKLEQIFKDLDLEEKSEDEDNE